MDVALPGQSNFCAGPSYCELQAGHQSLTPGTTHGCGSGDELTVARGTWLGQRIVAPDGRVISGVVWSGAEHIASGTTGEISVRVASAVETETVPTAELTLDANAAGGLAAAQSVKASKKRALKKPN